ncbi:MAG TPA: GYD domain-containing protein [Alphaproteobacteria bacterium]|nr:GYD domain-containing protein [Alphaproteobacteria bacterium]
MLTFILSLSFTDQGIRTIKDAAKRVKGARDLAKKLGVEVKQVYLTSGESDIVVIADTANGDNIAKFVLALGARGNVRSRTARAWSEAEYLKLVSELP